ncbi:MAG: 50S ribosomal protein L6 [Planctomycetes bacterium]|nr:50S ribosomal protein L6 [Planctomycetota bacterium]
MSRIGKQPIDLPAGVDVKVDGRKVTVKGPKGSLDMTLNAGIRAEVEDKRLQVMPEEGRETELSPFHGLNRALLQNMVVGVTQGYTKQLEIHGTGYQAKMSGNKIELQIGFAHPVFIQVPGHLNVELPTPEKITITGIDKQAVGELAAVIRRVRKPEPYKGKGIRYADEVVRRKAGKTMGG